MAGENYFFHLSLSLAILMEGGIRDKLMGQVK
jgi:hypothetical protein